VNKPDLRLDPRLMAIVEQDYPRFSRAELARRRTLMAQVMEEEGVDHLVACAAFYRGGVVHWLSDWLATTEAVLLFTPGRPDTIYVQYYNHLPQAQEVMPEVDFRWGGESTIESVIAGLRERGARRGRVGAVGLVSMHYERTLAAAFGPVHDLNRRYAGLRMVKSAEEIDRYRIGARMGDLAIEAMQRELRPGLDERDVAALIESAYLPWRGTNIIHFLGITSMHAPTCFVPRQHTTTRRLQKGDAVSCEISASFFEYWGQVLRTFTIGEPPTPLYRRLHETAEEALDAIVGVLRPGAHVRELMVGARVIEAAGFTFYDDLVHGYGGGYLPPVIGSPTRENGPLPDLTLRAGMMLVVQPNVITKDRTAGVQTGELFVITEGGAESLHTAPRGLIQVGA
jgi:Xaa-Pro aminopeptidase